MELLKSAVWKKAKLDALTLPDFPANSESLARYLAALLEPQRPGSEVDEEQRRRLAALPGVIAI